MVVILASFAFGVQLQLITLVMASYGTVPLGDWTALRSGVLEILLSSFSGAVKAGVVIGLPFLSLAMGIELVIACAARLTPGISLSPHSMQIKNLAALGLVILGWDRISAGFLDWTRLLPAFVEAVIGALGK